MSVRQYEPYAAQLGLLSENIHRHLTERECGIFDRGLADYHRRRNVKTFVECLSLVLNTNQKRQLLIPIRDTYVKPSDTGRFNQLVQARGLATSLKKKRRETEGSSKSTDGIHKVDVKRDANGEWGFNIRGGSDQGTGVFVSWVEPESNAHRSGLQVGDQILKANETSFENINHHDAVQLVRDCKRIRLWLLSHGRVPSTRMAHKVYRWVDPEGRETSPPPDPFIVAEQRARGDYRFGSEADERKVTVMVDSGKELGISIRGGSEHGLGIYVSKVDEASVAEAYGIKVGDQILEVNGVSFLNIVHSDAARALRAQPCMVVKVKDVGKLPHSRITTYGKTQWHQGKQRELKKDPNSKAFQKGAGTQVMLRKHETGIQSRGMMNEVARSVLTSHELSTFTYYIDQYESRGLSVNDLATALLHLLDTPEKVQLLSEVRGVIRASDLDLFNELTIHQEIAAKKAYKKGALGSVGGSQTALVSRDGSGVVLTSYQPRYPQLTIAEVHQEGPQAMQSQLSPPAAADMSFSSDGNTLTLEEDVDFGGRDQVPQRMSPVTKKPVTGIPVFHAPPPPSTEPATSTPDAGGHTQTTLVNGLKERRQRMRPGLSDQSTVDTEDGVWDPHSLSAIRSPQLEVVSSVSLPEIEARIQQELEQKIKKDFEEKERQLQEEHHRKLEHEKQEKEEQLRLERESLEQQLVEAQRRTAREVEERVRREAEMEMRRQIEESERAISERMERLAAEQQERLQLESQREIERRREREEEEKERLKMELEERIWREAEESLRQEFESRMHRERENLQHQSEELRTAALDNSEQRLRRELETKYQQQYEQQLQEERQQLREREQEEQRRMEALERQKHKEEIQRMEAEEQAKIEMEEKIKKETEAAVRAEYEAKLQFETEQRARLAEEVKARKAAEERLEQERATLEREHEMATLERERERTTLEREREREQQKRQKQQQKQEREKRRREEQEQQAREQRQREEAERREAQEAERRRKREESERRKREDGERRERQEAERREREEAEKRERKQRQEPERREREKARKQNMNERQHLALERQQKEREEEEQCRQTQQQQRRGEGGGDTEDDDEDEKMLKTQREQSRQQQLEEEEEDRRQEEQERREREAAMAMKQSEAERRKELQRKREENIRRREEEQRRKEEEKTQRLAEKKRQQEQEERKKRQEEVERARNVKMKSEPQVIAVKFGDETDGAVRQRQQARDQVVRTHQLVEEERRKAEEKLKRRMEKMKVQKMQNGGGSLHTDSASEPQLTASGGGGGGKSFGGYTDLEGEIVTVAVTKVCKKLGIAIDGGANTKQKAVIIREISPEGCAALTAVPSLRVGQQLLQVDSTSLCGLKHKETVMAIKGAFEGPMNKTISFIVLDSKQSAEETDGLPGEEGGQTQANETTSDQVLEQFPEPTPEPQPQLHPLQPPQPQMQPHPQPQPQVQVQLRKKKRSPEVEERMREKGLDEFIAHASSDLPSRRQQAAVAQETGISFGGYTNLHGEILTIPVSKVNKKLGMAIDGGANTKQKAITIRQITPDGSAALSGVGLKLGQQILQVNSRSLYKLSHSEAVAVIKSAFEGPLNTTTITFIVLDPQ